MDEQRVPDLEQMDEQQVPRFLAELFSDLSAEAEYEMRHEDYVMEMPQSGEHIRGREKMRQLQEDYPAPPTIQLRRVVVREGLWDSYVQSRRTLYDRMYISGLLWRV
jgi:hypothetical protein